LDEIPGRFARVDGFSPN